MNGLNLNERRYGMQSDVTGHTSTKINLFSKHYRQKQLWSAVNVRSLRKRRKMTKGQEGLSFGIAYFQTKEKH